MADPQYVWVTGDQDVEGHKHFLKLAFFPASYSAELPVGVFAPAGLATQFITPAAAGQCVVLEGRRHDGNTAGNVIVRGKANTESGWRTGAYQFQVNTPRPHDTAVFMVAENGDVHFGQGFKVEGGTVVVDPGAGSHVDIASTSGHVALKRARGHYLALRGAGGGFDGAKNADGSAPEPGPYTHSTPEGERYNYAGGHGDVDLGSEFKRVNGGFLAEFYNPLSGTGARTDHRAYIDYNGAYSQNHQLTLAQFPSPQQVKVTTNVGEFFYEAAPGTLMWAVDTQHWYSANPVANEWRQLAEQPDVEALKSRVTSLETQLAAVLARLDALESA